MEEKRDWSKNDTAELIQKIESFPEIWDVHSRDFKDRLKKSNAFSSIAQEFNTSPKEILRKWHNLKTQFSQEIKLCSQEFEISTSETCMNPLKNIYKTISFLNLLNV